MDTSAFNKSLDAAKAKVKAFESEKHEIKISAVFDSASLSKARQMFAQLDQQLSNDAMSRLRSSPQGSVLGSLNALFSPHQVTGAPSAQQAGQQGLLGQMMNSPAGVGTSTSGTSSVNTVKDVLTGQKPGNTSTTDTVRQVVGGDGPKDTTTADEVKEHLDEASAARTEADAKASGDRSGKNWASSFSAHVSGMLSRLLGGSSGGKSGGASNLVTGLLKGNGGGEGGIGGALNAGGIAGGALPGIAGVSGMAATVTGLGAALVSVLPAMTGVLGGLTAIGGGFLVLEKTNKSFAADMKATMTEIEGVFTEAAAPLAAPLEKAASQIGGYFKNLEPEFQAIFAGSGNLVQPLVKAIEGLVSGVLPGFLALIKAGGPVFDAFASSMSGLGKNLGSMLSDFASASSGSSVILSSLVKLVGSLLPFIGDLAKSLVSAVAPAFAAFSGALGKVLPALTPLMSVLGQFAGAVLADLANLLSPIGSLLVNLAPSFTTLAKAAAQVFTALENDGVFATLGNALENLAGPIANLVNALVKGLAPALPGIVSAFGQLANAVTAGLSAAIAGVANALTAIVKAVPPGVMIPLVDSMVALFAVFKGYGLITSAVTALAAFTKGLVGLDIAAYANPIGLVVTAIAALAAGFYVAWEKSAAFRNAIQDIGSAMLAAGIVVVAGARDITNAFLTMVGGIIQGAADAFGWVPGIGGKLKSAAAAVDSFKNSANGDFNSLITTMQGWQSELTGAQHTVSVTTNQINNDFSSQAKAATNAKSALTTYTTAITQNGVNSSAAKSAREQLITDLVNAGVKSGTAKTDVDNYTTAVKNNGTSSDAAKKAREQLITDILNASTNAKTGKTDLTNYTNAVKTNGSDSTAAKGARAQLIKDLENAGLSAKEATALVDGLTSSLNKVPKSVTSVITIEGQAQGTLTAISTTLANQKTEAQLALGVAKAAGGLIRGPGGPKGDKIPAWLSDNEYVIQADAVSKYGAGFLDMINAQRLASGGMVTIDTSAGTNWVNSQGENWANTVESQWAAQNLADFKSALASVAAASTANSLIHPSGSGATIQALMQSMAASVGWTGAEWTALNNVEMREAGYNLTAQNPTSSAYGLAQFINGASEYAQYGGNSTTAQGQITAMLNYIKQRYGDPEAAWAMEQTAGYYGNGGMIAEPVIGYGANSGRRYVFGESGREQVTPASEVERNASTQTAILNILRQQLDVQKQIPAGVGQHVGGAINGSAHDASFRARYPGGRY